MFTNCLEIRAIFLLFFIYMTRDTICETTTEITLKKNIGTNTSLPNEILEKSDIKCKGKKCLRYWMSMFGPMQDDLTNVQAMIVKDYDAGGSCDPADRQSKNRFLMCAGSILNRNHVLTSAACLHKATHIRHNVRGALSVVIAPLKSTIQVIRVTEYKVHPGHNTNPYSQKYTKHNLAILKLSCRIDMANFHRIELPTTPFVHACSEENCVIAIYRKIRRTAWVMFQISAPHVPLPNRRRKETMIKDGELRKTLEDKKMKIHENESYRSKKRMAETPIFVSRYETRKSNDEFFTINSMTENSPIDQSTKIFDDMKNSSILKSMSLKNVQYEDWLKSSGNETIKSVVVRSSNGRHSCAQTGAAVMTDRIQTALVSVSCDDRQPSVKWGYTDLYENLDWIHEILRDWNVNTSVSSLGQTVVQGQGEKPGGGGGGNFSTCSTCIFNFFIEIGCKDKNQCGNKTLQNSQHKHKTISNDSQKYENSAEAGKTRSQSCSGKSSVGVEIGVGHQGCEKGNEKIPKKPENRVNWEKSLNEEIIGVGKQKHLPLANERFDDISKLEKPVTSVPLKKIIGNDQRGDRDKYTRNDDNSKFNLPAERRNIERPLPITRTYKTSNNDNKNRERINNEIGLQNIDGDSADWLREVEKGLQMSSGAKRELVQSKRPST